MSPRKKGKSWLQTWNQLALCCFDGWFAIRRTWFYLRWSLVTELSYKRRPLRLQQRLIKAKLVTRLTWSSVSAHHAHFDTEASLGRSWGTRICRNGGLSRGRVRGGGRQLHRGRGGCGRQVEGAVGVHFDLTVTFHLDCRRWAPLVGGCDRDDGWGQSRQMWEGQRVFAGWPSSRWRAFVNLVCRLLKLS